MGVVLRRSTESRAAELEDLRRAALQTDCGFESGGGDCSWKGEQAAGGGIRKRQDGHGGGERLVCVTSGASYVGFAVVNCLLRRGYSVLLAVETQEDLDKLREMELSEGRNGNGVYTVITNVMDMGSLCAAFHGCAGVFHTSAFADPGGISGYSKHMAEMEALVAGNVVEACVRTPSVRRCVFTSSLLACVWRRNYALGQQHRGLPTTVVVDEDCWSDESLCRDKKLWFALGKTMAERAVWQAARGTDLKLATVCPGLVTGPGFCSRNPSASIAYLKGGREMFAEGLLATVGVGKVAEAQLCVYEAMGNATACGGGGRYICFDSVVGRGDEVVQLEQQLGLPNRISVDGTGGGHPAAGFELSNRKLSRLMLRRRRCTYYVYSIMC